MNKYKIGDEIYHKSNPSVIWIVERISENEVYCSTLIKETLEQKKEIFIITSIEKFTKPQVISGKRKPNDFW